MLAGLHDQGRSLLGRLPGDIGQLVGGQVSQVVTGFDACSFEFGDQIRRQAIHVVQVLAHGFSRFFFGNGHGQQHVFGAGTQLGHGVFVKAFNFQHFLYRHVGHFFQAGKAFPDQNVGHFLVYVQLFHEQRADRIGFVGQFLGRLSRVHDVDLPAGQFRRQAHVLTTATNSNGEVFLVHHHVHGVTLFVHHDGADVGRGQRTNDKLRRVLAPQHNVNTLARQFIGDAVDARAAHAYTCTDGVYAFVV